MKELGANNFVIFAPHQILLVLSDQGLGEAWNM
jgi:hypothetical protein